MREKKWKLKNSKAKANWHLIRNANWFRFQLIFQEITRHALHVRSNDSFLIRRSSRFKLKTSLKCKHHGDSWSTISLTKMSSTSSGSARQSPRRSHVRMPRQPTIKSLLNVRKMMSRRSICLIHRFLVPSRSQFLATRGGKKSTLNENLHKPVWQFFETSKLLISLLKSTSQVRLISVFFTLN